MSTHAPPPRLSVNSSDHSLDDLIDQLAGRAREDIEPAVFFSELLRQAVAPSTIETARLWSSSAGEPWRLVACEPGQTSDIESDVEALIESLSHAAAARQPQSTRHGLLTPIVGEGPVTEILEVQSASPLPINLIAYQSALAEVSVDYLLRAELRRCRSMNAQRDHWDHLSQQLAAAPDLHTACIVAVNDGRAISGCDRVSLLVRDGRRLVLRAVSGVDQIDTRSAGARSLESIGEQVAKTGVSLFIHAHPTPTSPVDSLASAHMSQSGATAIGVMPISASSGEVIAISIVEQFSSPLKIEPWKAQSERLIQATSSIIRARWSEEELARWQWRRWLRRLPGALQRPGTLLALLACLAAALILTIVPAEFTVSGSAKLWPAAQREIFASTQGIVDQLHVDHGDSVTPGQPLVVVRDPVLDAEFPRLVGEIATISERLRGIQAARLSGAVDADTVAKSRRMTADEEELKVRLASLAAQRTLLEERRSALTHTSPIAGQILTWDVAKTLTGRPVDRGQILLTVGDVAGPWIVEVDVDDRAIGDVLRARLQKPDLPVEMMLAADPSQTFRGLIRDVSSRTQADSHGGGFVRMVVEFDRDQLTDLRPGAVVIPRIQCGKRSLGAVWFHDLITAIRTRILF